MFVIRVGAVVELCVVWGSYVSAGVESLELGGVEVEEGRRERNGTRVW